MSRFFCLLAALLVTPLLGSCKRSGGVGGSSSPFDQLESALRPARAVAGLKGLPSAHFTGTAFFRVSPRGQAPTHPVAPDAVTTKTELWLDGKGHYRFVETNDQGGGREVTLHGGTLAVALRDGKATRRRAIEPEPTRLLEEAIGAPWAAWDTIRGYARVETGGDGVFRIGKLETARLATADTGGPLRAWRQTVKVEALEGEARVDPRTGAVVAFRLKARFGANRAGTPVDGELSVDVRVDQVGSTPAVDVPVAEDLPTRQRTVLEERALLEGP